MDISGANSLETCEVFEENCVLAIGIFDALHRGHAKVLSRAIELGKAKGARVFALTFYPHPAKVLGKTGGSSDLIYPPHERAKMLQNFGVDEVFFKEFTRDFASKSPEQFAEYLLRKFPNLKGIVTGENFRFGKDAAANVETLKRVCSKFGVETSSVSGVKDSELFVSSTRLRDALRMGKMEEFTRLSGKHYACEGIIEGGRHLGRTIGFPTLNLYLQGECAPPYGVYVSRLKNLDSGVVYDAVSSYGVTPTVALSRPVVETHLFEYVDFGEETHVRVELIKMLRAELKFESLEALKTQIAKDKKSAQEYFAANV